MKYKLGYLDDKTVLWDTKNIIEDLSEIQDKDYWMDDFNKVMEGDIESLLNVWILLNNEGRLILSIYMWDLRRQGLISSELWAETLNLVWFEGKHVPVINDARFTPLDIREMFISASKERLMIYEGDRSLYEKYEDNEGSITLWRGASKTGYGVIGVNWTTNLKTAMFFAKRAFVTDAKAPKLLEITIPKRHILTYLRHEHTVILDPAVTVFFNPKSVKWRSEVNYKERAISMEDITEGYHDWRSIAAMEITSEHRNYDQYDWKLRYDVAKPAA